MARIRSIKPEFFTSETVSQLPLRTRLTWIGLWTHCDNYGRARENVKLIKAAVWPLDEVGPKDIEIDLNTLADRGLIVRYVVGGKDYLAITSWKEHQYGAEKGDPKFPGPDEAESGSSLNESGSSLNESGSNQDESRPNQGSGIRGQDGRDQGGEDSDESSRPRKRGTRLPDDWKPDQPLVDEMRAEGVPDDLARRELVKFRDHWAAASGANAAKRDWRAAWRNWLRRELERQPKGRPLRAVGEPDWGPEINTWTPPEDDPA